jgi:hypothetical protein
MGGNILVECLNMNNEMTKIAEGRQKAVFDEIIKRARPGFALCWTSEGPTEAHIVTVKGPGKRYRLKISQDALESADEPANIPRLEREVQKELRVSESGKAVGYVKEAE